jgi:UDP-glucose 4-epimerase
LIIGGAGFIGRHLVTRLLETGREVTILDRVSGDSFKSIGKCSFVSGDFANSDLIRELLIDHSEVVHLAYATVPNTSFEDPLSDLLQNLPPAVQLFSEAAAREAKLILVSSGGTVYGEAKQLPIDEEHATNPISPYGVTKLTLEKYAHLYAVTHGLKFICLRPANAYGIGQRPFSGQGFIPTAIASAMKGAPIKVFGQNGTIRDYIHVRDLASGIACALEKGQLSETYNLGTGTGMSNRDIVEAMTEPLKKLGYEIRIENLPERAFDVKANILDSNKLRLHTGWQAQTDFNKGLLETIEWLKNFNE